MHILPYRKLIYNSPLHTDIIRQRVKDITVLAGVSRKNSQLQTSDYDGRVYEEEFDVTRIINYRNSFLPQINGRFNRDGIGCSIVVTMRPTWLVLIFGCVWFGGLIFGIGNLLMADEERVHPAGLYILLGMIVFGYLLFTIPFAIEADIAKKDLSRIFECELEK